MGYIDKHFIAHTVTTIHRQVITKVGTGGLLAKSNFFQTSFEAKEKLS